MTSLRSYLFAGMAMYWCATFRSGCADGVVHRPWLRLTIGIVFAALTLVSCALDGARSAEIERMRWDD